MPRRGGGGTVRFSVEGRGDKQQENKEKEFPADVTNVGERHKYGES